MNKLCKALGLGLAALLAAGVAWGQPSDGFSIMLGGAQHDGTIKITEGLLTGLELDYSSEGTNVGVDYQWAIGDSSSFLIFYQNTNESVNADLNAFDSAMHTYYGGQLRLWAGAWFIGVQAGVYELRLEDSGGSSSTGSGNGYGGIIGIEGEGGLYLSYQMDQADVAFKDADAFITGQRLNVGYRWK